MLTREPAILVAARARVYEALADRPKVRRNVIRNAAEHKNNQANSFAVRKETRRTFGSECLHVRGVDVNELSCFRVCSCVCVCSHARMHEAWRDTCSCVFHVDEGSPDDDQMGLESF